MFQSRGLGTCWDKKERKEVNTVTKWTRITHHSPIQYNQQGISSYDPLCMWFFFKLHFPLRLGGRRTTQTKLHWMPKVSYLGKIQSFEAFLHPSCLVGREAWPPGSLCYQLADHIV